MAFSSSLALGAVMVGVSGKTLTDAERERLAHPNVGGVILFSRNFESVEQVTALCAEIRAVRHPSLLIAVDHEGGRVQRFREGFSRIPPMQVLGQLWDQNPHAAKVAAREVGWVLAAELRAVGVDFSFTPVVDLNYGHSVVIGDRSFHADPQAVTDLAYALMMGLRQAGMQAVAKHFPGHGYVEADSHTAIPVDNRAFDTLWNADMVPFRELSELGLAGVMPAHVVYPQVDALPAGFSAHWLKTILRTQCGFNGAIFSDDLCMEGAAGVSPRIVPRAKAALDAGCDMVLVCNRPDLADEVLDALPVVPQPVRSVRLIHLHGRHPVSQLSALRKTEAYQNALRTVDSLWNEELPLGPTVGE